MSHVRQQIRDYAADLLVGFIYDRFQIVILDRFSSGLKKRQTLEVLGTGTLYKFRTYALDEEHLPVLLVYTTNDITNLSGIGNRKLSHSLELRVDVINKGSSIDIFENIEQFCSELNNAIEEDYQLGGLVKSCILSQSEFAVKTSGEKAIGVGTMIFDARYITAVDECRVSI